VRELGLGANVEIGLVGQHGAGLGGQCENWA